MKYDNPAVKLDNIDIKILSALSRDGRMAKLQLSEEVNLSATPCWERMKKLEKAGLIKGYYADINLRELVGVSYYYAEITLKDFSLSVAKKFEQVIMDMPQILQCEATLGDVDYLVKILSRDVDEYLQTIEKIQELSHVEIDYKTLTVSKIIKTPQQANIMEIFNHFFSD